MFSNGMEYVETNKPQWISPFFEGDFQENDRQKLKAESKFPVFKKEYTIRFNLNIWAYNTKLCI